jgi:hypothetical protein
MNTAATDPDGSGCYEIRLQGRLDARWDACFEGLTLTTGDGFTLLAGPVTDQAALHGLLAQIEALGLELLELRRLPPRAEDRPESPGRVSLLTRPDMRLRPVNRTTTNGDRR